MKRLLIVGSGDITERSIALRAALAKGGSLPQRFARASMSVVCGSPGGTPVLRHG